MPRERSIEDLIGDLYDGRPVDWAAALVAANDAAETKTVEALQLLAKISDANLQHQYGPPTALPFHRWRHLRLIASIGHGQHGDLYRAWDDSLQLLVALKVFPETSAPATQALLLEEARMLARVRHDNVVRVYGADIDHGRVGYWMELVDGTNLDPPTLRSPLAAITVGLEVARALAAIHQAGVVHGDVKPANILRTPTGQIRLVDFSVAHGRAGGETARPWVAGTPYYMAPELNGQLGRYSRSGVLEASWSLGTAAPVQEMIAGRELVWILAGGDLFAYKDCRAGCPPTPAWQTPTILEAK